MTSVSIGEHIYYHGSTEEVDINTTVAYWVTHPPKYTEDVGSNPGTGRYIVARMNT